MSTLESTPLPGFIELAFRKASHGMAKKRVKRTTVSASAAQLIFRFVMHIAGFGCLTVAGFALHFAAGMITAGFSCFALSWLMSSDGNSEERR